MEPPGFKTEGNDFILMQDKPDPLSQVPKTIEGESILHSKPYMELEIKLVSESSIQNFNPTSETRTHCNTMACAGFDYTTNQSNLQFANKGDCLNE